MFSSPLQRALARGIKPAGDLADELERLGDYVLRTTRDAAAVCKALRKLPWQRPARSSMTSPLHALTALFQTVDDSCGPALQVLRDKGIPQLIRVFDAKMQSVDEEDVDDLLFVLKILAMYATREGAKRIVHAARRPLHPDAYMWHVILEGFTKDHPQRSYVIDALSDPLPDGFLAVALLDSANRAAIDGLQGGHPFDSDRGCAQLRRWLEDRNPESFSYAHSATAALPFLHNLARDQLLALALDHVDSCVRLEAAWAAGKLDRAEGFRILAEFCLDVKHSNVAQQYLAELDRNAVIPAEATEPAFQAQAEFTRWLAHPNELGKPPDEMEIIDHRELAWPPERALKPFWLIRYRVHDRTGMAPDDVDCGLVGSMTWCFFSFKMHLRPPEDVYAIHCYWEMKNAGLIEEAEVTDASEYAGLLSQWQGAPLLEPRITYVAELSPQLNYPARLVAVAPTKLDGREGWVALDGPRSTWFPKAEQPQETYEHAILMMHVGRQLLGFRDQPNRAQYLVYDPSGRQPEQIVSAYEKLMEEAERSHANRQKELLGHWGLLSKHYDAYVESVAAVNPRTRTEIVLEVYGRFLQIAADADESIRSEAFGSMSVLGEQFDSYCDALVQCGRSAEIADLLDLFAPYWDNNLGYSRLGAAAFKAAQRGTAEHYLVKLREGLEKSHQSEEMSLLAEIWHGRGSVEEASGLLLDCLGKLVADIRESKYNCDRAMHAKEFQHHRSTYLRLFPFGEAQLAELGIPADPLG